MYSSCRPSSWGIASKQRDEEVFDGEIISRAGVGSGAGFMKDDLESDVMSSFSLFTSVVSSTISSLSFLISFLSFSFSPFLSCL